MRTAQLVGVILVAASLAIGCREQTRSHYPAERCAALARGFVVEFRTNLSWHAMDAAEIHAWFERETDDPEAPLCGLSALLRDQDAGVRRDAAYLLGYLRDSHASAALSTALADESIEVRLAACRAIGWLGPDDASAGTLARVRRDDPSLDVRVAAAGALAELAHPDALTAFRLGLSSRDERLREACELALEKAGELTLPLPESVYWGTSWNTYLECKDRGRVVHEVKKDGYVYFETFERVPVAPPPGAECALGSARRWYKARAEYQPRNSSLHSPLLLYGRRGRHSSCHA
jgi:hypothetical protein